MPRSKQMKIAVDATCWNNRRGFGRFTRELIASMAAARGDRDLILVADAQTASSTGLPADAEICQVRVSEPPMEAASAESSRSLIDLWRFRQAVVQLRPDAIFFPAVYSYFPVPSDIPTLVAIHDVIAETHPDRVFSSTRSRWLWNQKVRAALRSSKKIATVSENARQRIAAQFGRRNEDIALIGEGVAECFQRQDECAQRAARNQLGLAADEPILLYVGGISPHKNLTTLVRGLRLLADRGAENWRLVFVGEVERDSFLSSHREVLGAIRECRLDQQVAFSGYVDDPTLAALYSAARMLVLPSLDEGFGLPAAEAMACGTPVAASNAGALPEVVGDAGVFFDPFDKAAIASAIERLLTDDELHARCVCAGIERASQHRWSTVAGKVFSELDRIVASR
jgi:glycosyltransferase involved in cell wall biosynthesis